MAVHEGIWLGLLRERNLQRVTADGYAKGSTFSTDEHNRRGLFGWERSAVETYFPPGTRVVIAGAGGGREALSLVEQGFEVVAFDPDERLVEECRRRLTAAEAQKLTLMTAAPNTVPTVPDASFDAGIVGWGALGHMTSERVREDFLRAFAALIKPGAPVLISFHLRPRQSRTDSLRHTIAKSVAALTFGREPHGGDRFRIESNALFLHLFTPEEAKAEIEASGFSVVHFGDSPEAHVVAIKNRS
jgi:2-polyprenyl-3-methyl-5-hydroxy-6-metoxy-1,4-benzoquinol methylase